MSPHTRRPSQRPTRHWTSPRPTRTTQPWRQERELQRQQKQRQAHHRHPYSTQIQGWGHRPCLRRARTAGAAARRAQQRPPCRPYECQARRLRECRARAKNRLPPSPPSARPATAFALRRRRAARQLPYLGHPCAQRHAARQPPPARQETSHETRPRPRGAWRHGQRPQHPPPHHPAR